MTDEKANENASSDESVAEAMWFISACKEGDEQAVRELLSKNRLLVNAEANDAPLHYAVREGHERVAQLLLEHGADPHSVTYEIWGHCLSTLDLAKARGFAGVVALIEEAVAKKHQRALSEGSLRRALRERDLGDIKAELESDPSAVNTIDDNGNTPLHRAAEAEDSADTVALINFLLDHGAQHDVANRLGFTPVYLTLFRNHEYTYARPRWGLTQLLLARGAPYDINLASAKGDIERVRAFLANDAGAVHFQAPCKKRPLSCAAEFGHRDIVELLLKAGADPNAQELEGYRTFPLVAAVAKNDVAMVEMLLEHGADPNAQTAGAEVALGDALENGNREMANLIASYGGAQPVHCYAWDGDIVTLAAVLNENPALALRAVYIPNPERPKEAAQALRLALHHGLDPKQICHWSLFRASGNADLLRTFLAAGADPNVTAGEGRTLLHYLAADSSAKESVNVLLEFGADINARDDIFRGTPLTWAVLGGNREMVTFFLAHGASIDLPDDERWTTPRYWAEYLGHEEIAKLLSATKMP
jgi:cytohesin